MQRLPPAATEKRISRSLRMAPRLMRRNFSSRALELSGGEAIILSIPKSGRTWIRTFVYAYFCERRGRAFTLKPERYGEPPIPPLIFSHDLFDHQPKDNLLNKILVKYLIPIKHLPLSQ